MSEAVVGPMLHAPRYAEQTQDPATWITLCGVGPRDGDIVCTSIPEQVTCSACIHVREGGPVSLLTGREQWIIERLGDVWGDICGIVGDGPSRDADLAELCGHIHALQRAVMAQAAARVYPAQFRVLGRTVGDP